MLRPLSFLAFLCLQAAALLAQEPQIPPRDRLLVTGQDTEGAPVGIGADTLFEIRTSLGPLRPEARAAAIEERIRELARDPYVRLDSVRIVSVDGGSDIVVGERIVMTVTEADAAAAGASRVALAQAYAEIVETALQEQSLSTRFRIIILGVLFALMAALAAALIFRLVNRIFPRLNQAVEEGRQTWIRAIKIQRVELVSAGSIADGLLWVLKVLRVLTLVMLFYIAIPTILSFFPWTRRYADQLFGFILTPFARVWTGFLSYVPNIFTIGAITIITWYLLKLIRPIFIGLARGSIKVAGFYQDWAMPTYQIVRTLVIVFAFIAIWPYLPGSDSPAFRGVGVFLGLLLSLGSAAAIGNMIGGVVLTYMRPFRVGDRVKIADTMGDVVEKTLLVTRVRTAKNVDVTIPNSMILASHIINYSSSAKQHGLILHTTVTIGYDVPWRHVHDLLIGAARSVPEILEDPAPFVLQTALDDFYVSYELNASTEQPNRMAAIYSTLHAAIQDRFAEAGVEIMSPHYRAERDGSAPALPAG